MIETLLKKYSLSPRRTANRAREAREAAQNLRRRAAINPSSATLKALAKRSK